jgi:hypothetical protein
MVVGQFLFRQKRQKKENSKIKTKDNQLHLESSKQFHKVFFVMRMPRKVLFFVLGFFLISTTRFGFADTLQNTYVFDCSGMNFEGDPISLTFALDLQNGTVPVFHGFPDDSKDWGDPRNKSLKFTATATTATWQIFTDGTKPNDMVVWFYDAKAKVLSEYTNYGFPPESFSCELNKKVQVVQ